MQHHFTLRQKALLSAIAFSMIIVAQVSTSAQNAGSRSRATVPTSSTPQRPGVTVMDICQASPDSVECLKSRIDQLTSRLEAVEQTPKIPADLEARVAKIEQQLNQLFDYLRLGKGDEDDLWSAIKLIRGILSKNGIK